MMHTISGHNFHGRYSVEVRGPKDKPFQLSAYQLAKIDRELCGVSDCMCGGNYGDGPDDDSAHIDQYGVLHPTECTCQECISLTT